MKLFVTKTEDACGCGSCSAINFDSPLPVKKVDVLFDVQVGNTRVTLCEECLKALVEQANSALSQQ